MNVTVTDGLNGDEREVDRIDIERKWIVLNICAGLIESAQQPTILMISDFVLSDFMPNDSEDVRRE